MKLHPPFIITPRLMAGLKIGDAFVSIEYGGYKEGRIAYHYCIDLPGGVEHEATDLHSGRGGGSLQAGMVDLLCFLGACAESLAYKDRTGSEGENADLFPRTVGEWARQNSDEIASLQCEIEESETPLIEE